MSEHEFWNELGNLYFISGAYEPAIHAYARSIELDRGFGRPYSNLALAFVHTGKYQDAIELYHRSIELLTDAKEKAITWNRLGILYRQIKDYQGALVAYEQADKLDSRQDEVREEASRNVKYPLSVSMPPIDLQTILERKRKAKAADGPFVRNVNGELDAAEPQHELQWFDGDFVAPDPNTEPDIPMMEAEPLPEARMSVEEQLLRDISLSMVEEGWIPLTLEEPIPFHETGMGAEPTQEEIEEAATITTSWAVDFSTAHGTLAEDVNRKSVSEYQRVEIDEFQTSEEPEMPPQGNRVEVSEEGDGSTNQWVELNSRETIDSLTASLEGDSAEITDDQPALENIPAGVNEEQITGEPGGKLQGSITTEVDSQPVFENISVVLNDVRADDELNLQSEERVEDAAEAGMEVCKPNTEMEMTGPHPLEYSQVEYPLVELTPAEIDSIQIDIARFKRILQINPRNAFAWDTIGGLFKSLGKFKDAITSYQQAIALDSGKPSYYYQLGLMYSAERRDDEAMDAFQKVLSMDPHYTLAHASLGSHYRKMGLNDLAQQHIDIALKDVYEEENEYNQACLEAICGNTERALELLQVAIGDNPSYINWAQHDPDLDVLRHDQRFHMLIQEHALSR